MTRRRLTIGPGAASLILIMIVLSMSTLGILTLMNAENDLALSRRSAEVAGEVYALNDQAERSLAALDAAAGRCAAEKTDMAAYLAAVSDVLPEGMTLEGNLVTWEERLGARTLNCAAELAAPGVGPRLRWVRHELMTDSEEMGLDDPWN